MEDREILEEFINLSFLYGKLSFTKTQLYEYQTAIKNLLTRYKQLEKENEKLNQLKEKHNVRINDLCALVDNFAYNSIPVSLVKEKIEELNKLIIETQKELGSASKEYTIYVYQENILQELLREE